MDFHKLQGKHVLFIGGSTGLGFAAAQGALSSGAVVTIASSSTEKLDAAIRLLNAAMPQAKAHSVHVDLLRSDIDVALEVLLLAATTAN